MVLREPTIIDYESSYDILTGFGRLRFCFLFRELPTFPPLLYTELFTEHRRTADYKEVD